MRARLVVTATVAVLAGLAGCSPGPAAHRADAAQALGSIAESLGTASSAVATATLVIDLWQDDDLPAVSADTALGDATSDADAATHELATIVVPDAPTLRLRAAALAAAQQGTAGVAATRTWVGGGLSAQQGRQVRAALDQAADELAEATAAVEAAQGGGS